MKSFQPRYGASPHSDGGYQFRVWAPRQEQLFLRIGGRDISMQPSVDGEFYLHAPAARAGDDYGFVVSGGACRPDPASRYQPDGVHGPSRLTDPAFAWTDSDWTGLPIEELVFYELHVGTFTEAGTFEGVISKLDYLCDLGVNAIEIMPVAEFPGRRNWGYDGVGMYAPHSAYGGPEGLKRLVDACHARKLAVVLDVVYNHFGPEGNYLGEFAPYMTSRFETPWGDAIDYAREPVRRFFVDNALYWLAEFHIDALRLDAVHGIFDESPRHILEQIGDEFKAQAAALGRLAWLIAESERGDVREQGMDAIWHDEFHHAAVALMTGNTRGYLGRYGDIGQLAKSIEEGFVIWEADGAFAPTQLVAFVQNHDQIANPFLGDRQSALFTYRQQQVTAALLCFSPWLPLLFMGQEYGEKNPFLYFVSHTDAWLVEAVRSGRRKEFEAFYGTREFPDPQDPHTFDRCRLDWTQITQPPHSDLLACYRDLLRLRKRLTMLNKGDVKVRFDQRERWLLIERPDAVLALNLGHEAVTAPMDGSRRSVLFATDPAPVVTETGLSLEPWTAAIYSS